METGIVHTAPTFGADDAKVAKEASPEVPPLLILDESGNPVPLVDLQGRFRKEVGRLGGQFVKNEYYPEGEAPERSTDVDIAISALKKKIKLLKLKNTFTPTPIVGERTNPYCIILLTPGLLKLLRSKVR